MSTTEQLIRRYPKLYHMAESGSWPSIKRHGLLSTTALLDLFEVEEPRRAKIESQWRPTTARIEHPEHGVAVIRDQGPMPPETTEPLLVGITLPCWYRLINRKTFFWVSTERLGRFLNARPYKRRVHDVITVDTRELIRRHHDEVTLATFNAGVTAFGPTYQRSLDTFQSIEDYFLNPRRAGVVELAVDYHVPDIDDFKLTVEKWRGNRPLN